MTARRRRRLEDRPRRGLAPRPQPGDVAAVQQLTPHDRRAPDQLSADARRQDCRCLSNDQQVAERTVRMHLSGIRCFSACTRKRPWPVWDLVRPRHSQTRPVVWSLREVRSRLAVVEPPNARLCRQQISACGRRLSEGPTLHGSDSAAQRLLGRVHQGPGGKNRLVPLAPRVLA